MRMESEPPLREIVVFRPERFPLHRWDNASPSVEHRSAKAKDADSMPKLPFRRTSTIKGPTTSSSSILHASATSGSTNSEDSCPRCPDRQRSPERPRPSFLAPQPVGPCRRPPGRSQGFHPLDVHQIPLKPIRFTVVVDGKKKREIQEGFAQVLQEVVMERKHPEKLLNSVSVVFAIRRPGCGQCRLHGMQLAELVQNRHHQPHVHLTGVIKETTGRNVTKALHSFYTDYFPFPLYKDEGWNLYHTIGNKKLSVFKLCARGAAMELQYRKQGIRNIPMGGDLFTQGGILIFDKDAKLRFVYYETYGKPLDIEAINWAIEEASKPVDS